MKAHWLPQMERSAATHAVRQTVLALLASVVVGHSGAAQTTRTDVKFPMTFSTAGQSMWSAGTAALDGVEKTYSLANVSWDVNGQSPAGITDVAGFKFGAEFQAASKGALAVVAKFSDVGTGSVAVNYPVIVTLGLPDVNSFKEGETISIPSTVVVQAGAAITTQAPGGKIRLSAQASLGVSASARFCLFECTSQDIIPSQPYLSEDVTLFSLSVDPQGNDVGELLGKSVSLPYKLGEYEYTNLHLRGSIGLPKVRPVTVTSVDGLTLIATDTNTFVDLELDIDEFVPKKYMRYPLDYKQEILGFTVDYLTVDFSGFLKLKQKQTFSFTPTVLVNFSLPQPMSFQEVTASGASVSEGHTSDITFRAGNTLKLTFPAGVRDALNIQPSFVIENSFTSTTVTEAREGLKATALRLDISAPSYEIFPKLYLGDPCRFANDLDFLDLFSDEDPCPLYSPAVNSPSIHVGPFGPIYDQPFTETAQDLPAYPVGGTWELEGFTTQAGAPFTLDPENPIITVATTMTSGLATSTGPQGTVSQGITVRNAGDVALSAAQIVNALSLTVAVTPFTVRGVTTALSANAAFNGLADPSILGGGNVLPVGAMGTVHVSIAVAPGNVLRTALLAKGTSALGTTVRASAGAAFAVFGFDLLPSSLNDASDGVLPAVVLASAGMDVRNIDPATVRLVGVAPLRWELARGPKGAEDLTLKFDRNAVRASLVTSLATMAAEQPSLKLLDANAVASNLLGERELSADQLKLADGNSNGVIDIGDLRALASNKLKPSARASAQLPGGPADGRFLVLTGTLKDGTPFMGEDNLLIKEGTP